ncbi:NAD-dependent epimerase/dehydratase family protein [Glaciihabitans tibetensis]|uniref:NAD-dependent epimerase/dehydratase family protein n=1 Tax=Glaciihabitans tibetensis TaxID=1266600 RepID=UPI002481B0A7|nr:NAD-dependent epimerase/dehydratase family protein [Glaciihabitans tibetensis]
MTGAGGAMGRTLVRRLSSSPEHTVIATYHRVDDTIEVASFQQIELDITDTDQVDAALQRMRPDAVVHLAALVGAACESDPDLAEKVNVEAVASLTEAAARHRVAKLVFISTAAVYGDGLSAPVSESHATHPTTTYARTKLAAEEGLENASRRSDTPDVVVLRVFNVWGDGFSTSLVERLRTSSEAAPVMLNGLDTFLRDYVHVDDVVQACELALTAGLSRFEVVNIGSGVAVSNADLVRWIARATPPVYEVVPAATSYSCADIAKAERVLGYSPEHTIIP